MSIAGQEKKRGGGRPVQRGERRGSGDRQRWQGGRGRAARTGRSQGPDLGTGRPRAERGSSPQRPQASRPPPSPGTSRGSAASGQLGPGRTRPRDPGAPRRPGGRRSPCQAAVSAPRSRTPSPARSAARWPAALLGHHRSRDGGRRGPTSRAARGPAPDPAVGPALRAPRSALLRAPAGSRGAAPAWSLRAARRAAAPEEPRPSLREGDLGTSVTRTRKDPRSR